ncbi:flagellar assembly protein H [Phormidium willei BDU 130791]|nr:flagellar assembly protein H [Phormidium willei BDU 130791]
MYDNICKFLAETFPDNVATWLLGRSVQLSQLSPKELSNEPIRADAIILQQSEDLVLHSEFQTQPSEEVPFRMTDYRLRGYRRFPHKRMIQVVVYLKPSNSPLVYQDYFHIEGLQYQFRVIRLWEQPKDLFLQSPGLLPFAVLSRTDNRSQVLNQVAEELDKIEDRRTRSNLATATGVLAGLVLDDGLIRQIIRRDVMRESVVYQEILQEGELIGEQRGILAGKQQVAINLLRQGMTVEQVVTVTELPRDVVEKLRDDNG